MNRVIIIISILLMHFEKTNAQMPDFKFDLIMGKFETKVKDSSVSISIVDGQFHYVGYASSKADFKQTVDMILIAYRHSESIAIGTGNIYLFRKGKRGKHLYVGISTLMGNFCMEIKEKQLLEFSKKLKL